MINNYVTMDNSIQELIKRINRVPRIANINKQNNVILLGMK